MSRSQDDGADGYIFEFAVANVPCLPQIVVMILIERVGNFVGRWLDLVHMQII